MDVQVLLSGIGTKYEQHHLIPLLNTKNCQKSFNALFYAVKTKKSGKGFGLRTKYLISP